MENVDLTVLRALRDWRLAGKRALLATVVRTWGSSPRPAGSIMALREDGSIVGSVSGGCIEDDMICRFTHAYSGKETGHALSAAPPVFVKYGVTADDAHRFGLPCGGTLELLLEFDPDPQSLTKLVSALEAGRLMRRDVRLADGAVALHLAEPLDRLMFDESRVSNTFGPEYRMLLIGGGQLTECLATMALLNGFAVTVCDPREEYRSSWTLQNATLVAEMPDDAVTAFRPDSRSCVVALTHDPKLDDLALLEALRSDAFYIGAIGSRRNNKARRDRLIEHFGETEASLSRLRGPIGLYIGSKTPPEIAVSVMAEILAVKNGVRLSNVMDVEKAKNGFSSRSAELWL